jgi:hypothetical protein
VLALEAPVRKYLPDLRLQDIYPCGSACDDYRLFIPERGVPL